MQLDGLVHAVCTNWSLCRFNTCKGENWSFATKLRNGSRRWFFSRNHGSLRFVTVLWSKLNVIFTAINVTSTNIEPCLSFVSTSGKDIVHRILSAAGHPLEPFDTAIDELVRYVEATPREDLLRQARPARNERSCSTNTWRDVGQSILFCILTQNGSHWVQFPQLKSRKITVISFFDIVLDYFLMDSFHDLDVPPSAVQVIIINGMLNCSMYVFLFSSRKD